MSCNSRSNTINTMCTYCSATWLHCWPILFHLLFRACLPCNRKRTIMMVCQWPSMTIIMHNPSAILNSKPPCCVACSPSCRRHSSQNHFSSQTLCNRCPAAVRSVRSVPVSMLSFLCNSPKSIPPVPPQFVPPWHMAPPHPKFSLLVNETDEVVSDWNGCHRLSPHASRSSLFDLRSITL